MTDDDKVDVKKNPWHLVKLDDHAWKLLRRARNKMKARGQHASYSDAIREAMRKTETVIELPKKKSSPLDNLQGRLTVET
jgi:Arc/MetJ-type ribon-helix-helix transcriptional regulator